MGEGRTTDGSPSSGRTPHASRAGSAGLSTLVRPGTRSRGDEARASVSTARSHLREHLSGILDLLLPRVCICCDQLMTRHETGTVCHLCWARLPRLASPQCERCGHPKVAG